jgi:ribosomal protein L19E
LHGARGKPAHLKVAKRLSLLDVGAQEVALDSDEADEIDEAREERELDELSEIMDSGDEVSELPDRDCTDGRRAENMWYASSPL